MTDPTLVLSHLQVEQKINRIAHQIYETHFEEEEVFIVGIANRGYTLANKLNKVLSNISDLNVKLVELTMSKDSPLTDPIEKNVEQADLQGKAIILVDDVLNTGRTLIYAVNDLLQASPKKLTTVVLVDRRHRLFPIRADYVGLTLSTTLQEHISVDFTEGSNAVFLK